MVPKYFVFNTLSNKKKPFEDSPSGFKISFKPYSDALKYTKMHIIASDFSKSPRGACPPDPPPPTPSGARASPELLLSVRKLTGA